jgi:hypothetical protein
MKKALAIGDWGFSSVCKTLLPPHVELSTCTCNEGGTWDCDPFDVFIEIEPAITLVSYEAQRDEQKLYSFGPWKEIALAAVSGQEVRRCGWTPARDIQWIIVDGAVRKKNTGEAVADYLRLPFAQGELRKLLE